MNRLLAWAIVLPLVACSQLYGEYIKGWPTFKGAWFDIQYPPGFKVIPRQPTSTAAGAGKYDAASFLAPDAKVEFYVYSPQWSGSPRWITLAKGEKVVSTKKQRKGSRMVTWVEIRGPQGKHYRAYVDTVDKLSNTRLVFGIKYSSSTAYQKYRSQYLKFKQSLRQYAD